MSVNELVKLFNDEKWLCENITFDGAKYFSANAPSLLSTLEKINTIVSNNPNILDEVYVLVYPLDITTKTKYKIINGIKVNKIKYRTVTMSLVTKTELKRILKWNDLSIQEVLNYKPLEEDHNVDNLTNFMEEKCLTLYEHAPKTITLMGGYDIIQGSEILSKFKVISVSCIDEILKMRNVLK